MLIGILQTGEAPDVLSGEMGDYPDMFRHLLDEKGLEFRTYRVMDMEFPASVTECDGWLITGSRHGVYEDHAFIPPLETFIREARAARVPMVGICFGHQIIAQALGGRVERSEKGWAVGPTAYDFGADRIVLNAWHRDQVIEPPADAEVIASNDFCAHAALLYPGFALTVQAHPEFRDDFIDGLMRTRGKGVIPDDRLEAAQQRLGQSNDAGRLADRIAQFFNQAR
ncbi:type 1 glutamine amidotransferase [Cereibacter azotoformans]|uniref:GMP synthase-like glutamine amidotransferase n=1 Tax=Cereibacter azotoformans TaxID=43057 RepID=A0A2T5JWL8_9RHOB|nr:type 1 glutamine amidotransferase [Cereibacter azotoformans]AXQ92980.1 type 1 glutamine amidotransferase [Cereibacter sphaeroides]MBO4169339.1 type 1 glutamine amidotransferase [Cereibacter azotoformans]PTR14561.1 GMP synthase-like glutamine amidotransferase [Cereibacter azotoformans]UIJ31273.1 type 1 glutamine amidotransferase [Cereibacter azotoformans]